MLNLNICYLGFSLKSVLLKFFSFPVWSLGEFGLTLKQEGCVGGLLFHLTCENMVGYPA